MHACRACVWSLLLSSDRTVLEAVTLLAKDSLGNTAKPTGPLHISLRRAAEQATDQGADDDMDVVPSSSSSSGVGRDEPPRLQGANKEDGVLEVAVSERGEYACPKLKLVEGAGTREGRYELVFVIQPGPRDQDEDEDEGDGREQQQEAPRQVLCVPFTFSTDTRRIKEINEVTQRLETLKRKRQARGEALSQLEARKKAVELEIRTLHE